MSAYRISDKQKLEGQTIGLFRVTLRDQSIGFDFGANRHTMHTATKLFEQFKSLLPPNAENATGHIDVQIRKANGKTKWHRLGTWKPNQKVEVFFDVVRSAYKLMPQEGGKQATEIQFPPRQEKR
jgi:hypothetical protein